MTLRGVQHSGLHEVGDLVLRALCGEDPDSTAQVNRSVVTFTKEWSDQRSSYLEFWDELFRTCAADIGLFSIEGLPERACVATTIFFLCLRAFRYFFWAESKSVENSGHRS